MGQIVELVGWPGGEHYDELRSGRDLPAGWTDERRAATYRLLPRQGSHRSAW